MIALLTLAALVQGASAGPPATVRVVGATRSAVIAVVRLDGQPAVRADELLPPLGGRVSRVDEGRWTVALPGLTLDLRDGLPFAGTVNGAVPLAGAPRWVAGVLVLPLSLVTELLPRLAAGFRYDAQRAELLAAGVVASTAAAGGGTVFARAARTVPLSPASISAAEAPTPGLAYNTIRNDENGTLRGGERS